MTLIKKVKVDLDSELKGKAAPKVAEHSRVVNQPKPNKHTSTRMEKIQKVTRFFIFIIGIVIFFGLIPYYIYELATIGQSFIKSTNFTIESNTIAADSFKKDPTLKRDSKGKTNIMIVGIDTRPSKKAGSGLRNTDTIILASYDEKTNRVSMLSFPRDLIVPYPDTSYYGKINAVYAYGENRKKGGGLEYLKKLIESISGTKIQYYGMVDLNGFIKIIDLLGGIDVYVDRAFRGRHPTFNNRWEYVNFKQGWQHMNGTNALRYARIRYAYPYSEASDFARARRQQKVIQAVIEKAQKQENLQNPKTVFEILKTVAGNIRLSQVTPEDIEAGVIMMKDKGKPTTFSMVLDPSAAKYSIIRVGGYGTGYTLTPKAGLKNWSSVKSFIGDYFNEPQLITSSKTIYIYNGGRSSYSKDYSSLRSRFYYVNFYNAGSTNQITKGAVYNFGGSSYEPTAKFLASYLKIDFVTDKEKLDKAPKPKGVPIVIVLGK